MTFNSALLNQYRTLLQTTDLQMAYQEFIRFFRYLRTELEKQMPDCKFQGGIVENAMEYAYFSLTNDCLRTEGLKIVVAFVHKTFQLEVWISGVNRKVQCSWKEKLEISLPFELTPDPKSTDFIARIPVNTDISNGDNAVIAVQEAVNQCISLLEACLSEKRV